METVKNQGRHDLKNKWQSIEDRWIEIIHKQSGDDSIQWLDPNICLSYQAETKPFVVYEEDFIKTIMDYYMYENHIDGKTLNESILSKILYSSDVKEDNKEINLSIKKHTGNMSISENKEKLGN